MRTLFVCLLAASCALQAETYKITVSKRAEVGGKMLEPGDYKLDVAGETACFRMGKARVEVPVRRETIAKRAERTVITYNAGSDMYHIKNVEPKGTNIVLSF